MADLGSQVYQQQPPQQLQMRAQFRQEPQGGAENQDAEGEQEYGNG